MKRILLSLAMLTASLAASAQSAQSACPHLYKDSVVQSVPRTVELCGSFFVVRYNAGAKAAVITVEKLVAGTPVGALSRVNSFHSDPRVPGSPAVNSYSYTGYDRGHMVPSDDAYTSRGMYETFAMTNMTPQNPTLNRGPWARLEQKIRDDFRRDNKTYHVTTVAVYSKPLTLAGYAKVPVPKGYWKVVDTGLTKQFYFADNTTSATIKTFTSVDINTVINNSAQALQ